MIFGVSFILAVAGFLLPFWPLSLLGVLLAAATGRYIASIVLGLLLDVVYGAPVGHWHVVYVPFTLAAFIASIAHWYLGAYFRDGESDTL
jgi:hypothetical protein